MTRKLQRRREASAGELTESEHLYLTTGFRLWLAHTLEGEGEAEAAYRAHREELISDYCAELGPFRRPWAWWKWTAPEPRRLVAPGRIMPSMDWGLSWGIPTGFQEPPNPPHGPRYESTRAYLLRLGLPLTPEERAAVKRTDDELRDGVFVGQEQRPAAAWEKWADWLLTNQRV